MAEPPRNLQAEIDDLDWYHTIELAPGVETPGWFDLREMVSAVHLPPSLAGKRCLDIGTFDGFWAFEMERRGAESVEAIDILDPEGWDWPIGSEPGAVEAIGKRKALGAGFLIARRELGSRVNRRELSIYDLDPSELGQFDLIYIGSLLLHLRDPIGALERVRSVCRGTVIICDAIDAPLTALFRNRPVVELDGRGRPWWWKPNLAGLQRMMEAAGFELSRDPIRIRMKPGAGHPSPRVRPRVLLSHVGRVETMRAWRGDPHAVVHARPRAF